MVPVFSASWRLCRRSTLLIWTSPHSSRPDALQPGIRVPIHSLSLALALAAKSLLRRRSKSVVPCSVTAMITYRIIQAPSHADGSLTTPRHLQSEASKAQQSNRNGKHRPVDRLRLISFRPPGFCVLLSAPLTKMLTDLSLALHGVTSRQSLPNLDHLPSGDLLDRVVNDP
ncbi:hypothetical protein IWX90DRAFT_264436 [Phyllosticta citrichinensis]|uniref:Uncharacterized protein n=1 Tax=Phyllosticta citrichinensis TaxID=1130410 RepID=A0ABR1XSF8_9PEZI